MNKEKKKNQKCLLYLKVNSDKVQQKSIADYHSNTNNLFNVPPITLYASDNSLF